MSIQLGFKKTSAKGWAIAAGVMVLLVGSVGVAQRLRSNAPTAASTTALDPDQTLMSTSISALGRISPQGEILEVSGPQGDRIAQLQVKEGDSVTQGQILAYLESHAERQVERDLAAQRLQDATAKLEAETVFQQAQIATATNQLAELDQPLRFQIEAQQANIRQLEAELKLAEVDRDRFEQLHQDGALSQQQLDQQRTRVQEVQEQLNRAQAMLTQMEQSRSTRLQSAQAQLQSAQANLPRSQVQINLESLRQELKLAGARLDRTIIRAPSDGRILKIHTQAGEAIRSQGILELGDTDQMMAIAEVHETDIGRVKIGQPATVTSRYDAFPETLTGTVQEIGWQIFKNDVLDEDPAAAADARVVEVKIQLDQGEPVQRLTNLQVDVRIDVES